MRIEIDKYKMQLPSLFVEILMAKRSIFVWALVAGTSRAALGADAPTSAIIANVNDGAAEGWVTSVYLKDPTDPQFDDDPGMMEYQEVLAEYASGANPDDCVEQIRCKTTERHCRRRDDHASGDERIVAR